MGFKCQSFIVQDKVQKPEFVLQEEEKDKEEKGR